MASLMNMAIDDDRKKEVSTAPPVAQQQTTSDLDIKGRFARYNSPFLQLLIPLLSARYVWVALEDVNPFNFLSKPDPAKNPGFIPWKSPGFSSYVKRNFAALGTGATLAGIIGLYSRNTYEDIRTVYAEAVGYELGKRPEDVTWDDLFQSKNAALEVTREAYTSRTLNRLLAAAAFLMPWQVFRDFRHAKPKYDANVNAGVGAVGTYLSWDGFFRTPSFFDTEQDMVATAITHKDTVGVPRIIVPENIQHLLLLQRRHLNPRYQWPTLDTAEGVAAAQLNQRIANLMNQTYNNIAHVEDARFTLGKFNYLVGFGLLDRYPDSLGFVELANRSTDMRDVKAASLAIKGGQDPYSVFQQYGIDLAQLQLAPSQATAKEEAPMPTTRFRDRVGPSKDNIPAAARTHQEFAEQSSTAQQGIV